MKLHKTATKMDDSIVQIFGGISFEGTTITYDQLNDLKKYYGYDSQYSEEFANDSVALNKSNYEKSVAEYKKNPNNKGKYLPKEPDWNKLHKESKRLSEESDTMNTMRAVNHDGRRIMAFLSKYLEKGEDPVRLVAEALLEKGYDVDVESLWNFEEE